MVSHSGITLPKPIHLSFVVRLLLGTALSALSAVLLALAMPPYGIWPLALLGLLPMILAQYRVLPPRLSSIATAVTIGGLVALYIMDAFLELPGAPWYMKGLPLIFGVFIFVTDLGTRAFHERTGYRWFVLSGALGWVGVEMIRSLVPVLGTWGFIAYAYFKCPWLIQPVSIFGIFGLSLVNLLLSFALGRFLLALFDGKWRLDADIQPVDLQKSRAWVIGTGVAFIVWIALSVILIIPQEQDVIRVAAVQPDFKSLWTRDEIATHTLSSMRYQEIYNQLFDLLLSQTHTAAEQGAELIVWPEGALNFDPQQSRTQTLCDLTAGTQAYLVIPYGVGTRNEVTILSPEGDFMGVYGKNHPVIFVNERSATRGTYPTYRTDLGEMGTIICYDLDFTDTARRVARNGATLIAVPSGDWPGIAEKHYAHIVFRAVENRVAMVKVDRSYDSAIIDPYGRIIHSVVSKEGRRSTLVADVTVIQANPLQRYLGDWIGWLSLASMVFFMFLNSYTSFARP